MIAFSSFSLSRIALLALLALSSVACHSSGIAMNMNAAAHENSRSPNARDFKETPHPQRAYQISMTIADAPGGFEYVKGTMHYQVSNSAQCGYVVEFAGVAPSITTNVPFELRRVSATEYVGMVYADILQDEDYYGRGVCHWEMIAVSVYLKATGAEEETRFIPSLEMKEISAGLPKKIYFWKEGYPRDSVSNYGDYGQSSVEKFKFDIRNELFSVTLTPKEVQP